MEDKKVVLNSPRGGYITNLDTLRLFAMILVFATHCYFIEDNPLTRQVYNTYFQFSGIGVEFFIILSGFFAAYTYKPQSIKVFMEKKIKRIMPTHWFCLIVSMYLIGLQKNATVGLFTPLSFFCVNTLIPKGSCANPASWTISTLMVLYLLTPIIIGKLTKVSKNLILPIALIVSTISTIINIFLYNPNNTITFWFVYASPYFRVITYSIGILLGLYVKSHRITTSSGISIRMSVLELAFYTIIGIFIYTFNKGAGFWYTIPIVILILLSVNGTGIISYLLKNKYLVQISKYSFSFYLIHFPIVMSFKYLISKFGISSPGYLYVILIVSFLLSFGAAIPIYHFVECKFKDVKISFKNNNK